MRRAVTLVRPIRCLDFTSQPRQSPLMVTLDEIEALALRLPDGDRAKLAANMLDSLPGVLVDEDDGIAEALRRSEEMDRDPSVCLSHEEFLAAVRRKG
jgi:hypothetical protein